MKPLLKKSSILLILCLHFTLANSQNTMPKKSPKMKNVLLVGRLMANIPTEKKVMIKNVYLIRATNLEEVRSAFEKIANKIDNAIMGAGIELQKRLAIVEFVFKTSDTVTVHLKDRVGGPEGFMPCINKVLKGMVSID